MNSPKIGSQQNFGIINDYTLEFANNSSNHIDSSQRFSCIEQQEIESSTAIVDHSESPSSDFYVTEQRYMGFIPDGDFQNIGSNNDLQIISYASAPDKFSNIVDSFEQPDCSFQLRDTSESVPKSPLRSTFATCTEQIDNKHCSTPYVAKKDLRVYDGSYNPQLGKMQLLTQHGNLLLRPSTCGNTFANTTSIGPPVISSKARIRWTQDLHKKFVECVKCIGGSERATPKVILKLMNSDGLTIFHVKSRLQKYRIAKCMPAEFNKRTRTTGKMQLITQHGNSLLRPSTCGNTFANTTSIGPPVILSKARIRWTQDLHEKFVECVKYLGGSERASPRAILKLMNSDGLTIFQVKSRLQKYRISKYMSEESDKRTSMTDLPLLGKMQLLTQHENPLLMPSTCGNTLANTTSIGPQVISSKARIRWTQDLHEKFVECVKYLGGSERATPKAILKLMNSDGLTIFHVKSHLQKYRIAKYMPAESDKRTSMTDFPLLDVRTHLQVKEVLQLQLDVHKQLRDQLEVQKNLQLRIEEHSKQLKIMFEQQQRSSTSTTSTR